MRRLPISAALATRALRRARGANGAADEHHTRDSQSGGFPQQGHGATADVPLSGKVHFNPAVVERIVLTPPQRNPSRTKFCPAIRSAWSASAGSSRSISIIGSGTVAIFQPSSGTELRIMLHPIDPRQFDLDGGFGEGGAPSAAG